MKAVIYNLKGEKKGELNLPEFFNTKIREDIVLKCYEAEKFSLRHPYSPYAEAGKRHSASGTISHKRHDWKGHYGKGISRVPRKTMWRRGTQFFWIGAEVASARGGRRAHPPRVIRRERKINKNEEKIAMHSALASTANEKYILSRYSTMPKISIKFPIIIESNLAQIKTKEFFALLKTLLGEAFRLALKNKSIRAGRGKLRGRKYKSNAGLLLITSKNEKIKMKGIEIKPALDLKLSDLYPLGRLTIFTESSMEELK